MDKELEKILLKVQKPARYSGGEYNQIIKDKSAVDMRIALCFPDTYEIGMSNLGIKILYGIFNKMEGVWCERVFAPWSDMSVEMRNNNYLLYGLESGDPIKEFDIVAFSIGYEMAYTTVLDMLDLAGIPIRSIDRDENSPLVVAGGTVCFNSEVIADFIDLFFIGEGEEVDSEVFSLYRKMRNQGKTKSEFLKEAAKINGVYVPSLYEVRYNENGTIDRIISKSPMPVNKRIVENLDSSYYPVETVIPSTEIVHDRVVLEVFRGCIRGCRFCQAGFVYRPVRTKSSDTLIKQGIDSLQISGYEQITLSSLSTSDYPELLELCDGLLSWCEPKNVGLSLPSLRADNFSMDIMQRVQKVRKSGLTFAPEAGTQRLRDVINKNVKEEDLLNSCKVAFEGGWNSVKLYFMLGLPTETDEDVVGIAELAERVLATWKKYAKFKNRGVRITVSTSCFVPKPHTPFQWCGQVDVSEYMRRVALLRRSFNSKAIIYNYHDASTSFIEAVLARGDRRLGKVIENVWKNGGKLESWSDFFVLDRWTSAFAECNIDPHFYANRNIDTSEVLPWSTVSDGVRDRYLIDEYNKAIKEGSITPDCRVKCSACGASCFLKGGKCNV